MNIGAVFALTYVNGDAASYCCSQLASGQPT